MEHDEPVCTPDNADEAREPEAASGDKQPVSRWRLYILVGLLSILCLGYGAMQVDQWLLRRELAEVAVGIVDEFNESDPLLESEEPQVGTDCTITVVREYLVFGRATGKIVFRFAELAAQLENGLIQQVSTTSERMQLGPIAYIYVRERGTWRLIESYHSRDE